MLLERQVLAAALLAQRSAAELLDILVLKGSFVRFQQAGVFEQIKYLTKVNKVVISLQHVSFSLIYIIMARIIRTQWVS